MLYIASESRSIIAKKTKPHMVQHTSVHFLSRSDYGRGSTRERKLVDSLDLLGEHDFGRIRNRIKYYW